VILRDDRHDDLRPVTKPPHILLVRAGSRVPADDLVVNVCQKERLSRARHLHDRVQSKFLDVEDR